MLAAVAVVVVIDRSLLTGSRSWCRSSVTLVVNRFTRAVAAPSGFHRWRAATARVPRDRCSRGLAVVTTVPLPGVIAGICSPRGFRGAAYDRFHGGAGLGGSAGRRPGPCDPARSEGAARVGPARRRTGTCRSRRCARRRRVGGATAAGRTKDVAGLRPSAAACPGPRRGRRVGPGYVLNPTIEVDIDVVESELADGRQAAVEGRLDERPPCFSARITASGGAPPRVGRRSDDGRLAPQLAELDLACDEERLANELDRGNHSTAIGELEALVGRDPTASAAGVSSSRPTFDADARQTHWTRCPAKRALAVELGIEPGPHLRQLERTVLGAQDVSAPLADEQRLVRRFGRDADRSKRAPPDRLASRSGTPSSAGGPRTSPGSSSASARHGWWCSPVLAASGRPGSPRRRRTAGRCVCRRRLLRRARRDRRRCDRRRHRRPCGRAPGT